MNGSTLRPAWLLVVVLAAALGTGGVVAAGEAPLADAGLDQQVSRNATVLLDAAGSRDPDGAVRTYRWSIETPAGLTVRPANASAARTSFAARQPGRYEATVTVWDDDGHSASDTLYVDVASGGPPPSAPAPDTSPPSGPERPSEPTPTGSSDSAGTTTTSSTGPGSGSVPACPDGERYLRPLGQCGGVTDQPPTITISGPTVVAPGSSHTFEADARDYPDGIDRVEWAGGETGTIVLRQFPDAATERTLRATVHDGEGNTRTARHTVYVGSQDLPPETTVSVSGTSCVGEPVRLDGTTTPRAGDRIERTWWTGGDASFTPGEPGVYSRTFHAADDDGQKSTATGQIRVEECERTKIRESEIGRPTETDRVIIIGSDTNVQATSDVRGLTRETYGEDAERMGGGFVGSVADAGEGFVHIARNSGETVAGQEERVLRRERVDESTARRAVRTSQGEYGRVETAPDESPSELLFTDDRALTDPTVVDGVDPDADRYVVVVKQDSRQDIVNRFRNGPEDVDSEAAPIESSEQSIAPAPAERSESGGTPLDTIDPVTEVGASAADRAENVYYEGLTLRDRLLDDGTSVEDASDILGDRAEDALEGTPAGTTSAPDSDDSSTGSSEGSRPEPAGGEASSVTDGSAPDGVDASSSVGSSARQTSSREGPPSDSSDGPADTVMDAVDALNPLSDLESGADDSTSSDGSSDDGTDGPSWNIPDSASGTDDSSESDTASSSGSGSSNGPDISPGSDSAWDL